MRWIYSRFLTHGRSESEIAAELYERGILTDLGRRWTRSTVRQILTNEKYIGNNVYNRRSFKLKRKRVANGPEMWIRSEGAFEAIVEPKLFQKVQVIIAARNRRFSDEEMLDRLTRLFQRHGYISGLVIDEADGMPSSGAYAHRFGSLLRAYSLVGFSPDRDYHYIEVNRMLRLFHGDEVDRVIREITRLGGTVARNPATRPADDQRRIHGLRRRLPLPRNTFRRLALEDPLRHRPRARHHHRHPDGPHQHRRARLLPAAPIRDAGETSGACRGEWPDAGRFPI